MDTWEEEGYEISEDEEGKYEVSFSGKITIEAAHSGDAMMEILDVLVKHGFLVENIGAYKQ